MMEQDIFDYDVSILILTYHSDMKRLKQTIYSCLIQENVKCQIVISDDGSGDFNEQEIIAFFEKYSFDDYCINAIKENGGTVKNAASGLKKCTGKYIKLFSAGDFLYGKDVLDNWINYMEKTDAVVSISDAIYFKWEKDELVPVPVSACFQKTEYKNIDEMRYQYLLYEECGLGAAVLVLKEVLNKYLGMVEDRVIYAEDHVYRLMIFFKENMVFYNKNTILYEYGTGISTCGNSVWHERLMNDLRSANQIMQDNMQDNDSFDRKLKRIFRFERIGTFRGKGILQALLIKGRWKHYVRTKMHPRITDTDIDDSYVEELINVTKKEGA